MRLAGASVLGARAVSPLRLGNRHPRTGLGRDKGRNQVPSSGNSHASRPTRRGARAGRLALTVVGLIGVAACDPDFGALGAGGALSDAGAGGTSGGSSGAPAVLGGGRAATDSGGTSAVGAAPSLGGASTGGIGGRGGSGAGGAPEHGGGGGDGGVDAGGVEGDAGAAQGGQPTQGEGGAAGAEPEPPLELVASASTNEFANVPANALDGDSATKWCALNGSLPQWWQVDLGAVKDFSSFEVEWETPLRHGYRLEISEDDVTFTVLLDNTDNPKVSQRQDEALTGRARYVRIFFTYLPPNDPWPHWACIREFSVITE